MTRHRQTCVDTGPCAIQPKLITTPKSVFVPSKWLNNDLNNDLKWCEATLSYFACWLQLYQDGCLLNHLKSFSHDALGVTEWWCDIERRTCLFFLWMKREWQREKRVREKKADQTDQIEWESMQQRQIDVCTSSPHAALTHWCVIVWFSQCEKCPWCLSRGRIIIMNMTFLTPQLWPLLWPLRGTGGFRGYACFSERQLQHSRS